MDALRAGATAEEVFDAHRDRPVVRRPAAADQRGRRGGHRRPRADPGAAAPGQAARLLRRPDRQDPRHDRRRRPRRAARARHPAGLQDRRHLRGRVRRGDAVPLLVLRRGDRGRAAREAGGDHPRLRARTGSARASSSTTRACTRRWRCSEAGYETVMVNCNPETVSTDYDTSDRLYFEPLTLEDVLEVVHAEEQAGPVAGVICQLGGQTPLGLAQGLKDAGVTDRRHLAGGDPPGRGARRLRPGARRRRAAGARSTAWPPSFAEAHGDRRRDRLPGAGAAVVRPRRPRHGDRLRRRRARGLHRARDRDQPGAPGAGRPVPRRRGRDRRRRALRRRRSSSSAA